MEFLVKDIASRLGFPLRGSTEAGGPPDLGVNNPPTAVAPQPSLFPTSLPMLDQPFSQLLPNFALYGADSYVVNHEAPISPSLINQPYNISHAGSDFGSGPSTSTYMGYIGGDQNVGAAYQSPFHIDTLCTESQMSSIRVTLNTLTIKGEGTQ